MSYFRESNHQERTSSSSSAGSGSSRKSKKSGGSDKPKQPQRGLGVAQLEKIRLHSQMGCTFLPDSLHHNPFDNNLSQEDMRLQTGYSPSPSFSYSSSSYGFPGHQGIMMSMSEMERANMRYGDSQASSNPSWHPGTVYEPQQYAQPNMTRHFLSQQLEDPTGRRGTRDRSGSTGSGDQTSDSQGNQELDLELRLSL
nr:protein SPEAR3-like [Ipomoea batatas]GME09184.1 protein SPEAR3-like [Ipomoea batatas]